MVTLKGNLTPRRHIIITEMAEWGRQIDSTTSTIIRLDMLSIADHDILRSEIERLQHLLGDLEDSFVYGSPQT